MGKVVTVERFVCRLCGYETERPFVIQVIKNKGGVCPSCQDGSHSGWNQIHTSKYTEDALGGGYR